MEFAKNFEFYLQTEKNLSINSSGKMIKNLKRLSLIAWTKIGLIKTPFFIFKARHIDPKVPHLTAEELKLIEDKEISIERLSIIRDVFLYSCYTGFAYVDAASLTANHIKIGPDGKSG